MTDLELGFVTGYFVAKGSFCRTGQKGIFALEMMSPDGNTLQMIADLAGGNVYKPPPTAPTRWTWRLYGQDARDLYDQMRPLLRLSQQERGDEMLAACA